MFENYPVKYLRVVTIPTLNIFQQPVNQPPQLSGELTSSQSWENRLLQLAFVQDYEIIVYRLADLLLRRLQTSVV